jgi:hypothetical protein
MHNPKKCETNGNLFHIIIQTSTLRHVLCLLRNIPVSNTDHYCYHGQLVHPHSHCHSHIHILFCVSWLDLRTKTLLWVEIKDKFNHKEHIQMYTFLKQM